MWEAMMKKVAARMRETTKKPTTMDANSDKHQCQRLFQSIWTVLLAGQFAAITKGCCSAQKKKLTQARELVQAQKGNILFTKWHDKRNVAYLSSNVSPGEVSRMLNEQSRAKKLKLSNHASLTYTPQTWVA